MLFGSISSAATRFEIDADSDLFLDESDKVQWTSGKHYHARRKEFFNSDRILRIIAKDK